MMFPMRRQSIPCLRSAFFDYEENDIAYQMQSNAHKIMIECMDNYSLDDYVNHSLGYYAKQLDEYNQDDNYATTILTLMDEQYHDYYDEKTAENPEKYYPIYDIFPTCIWENI